MLRAGVPQEPAEVEHRGRVVLIQFESTTIRLCAALDILCSVSCDCDPEPAHGVRLMHGCLFHEDRQRFVEASKGVESRSEAVVWWQELLAAQGNEVQRLSATGTPGPVSQCVST